MTSARTDDATRSSAAVRSVRTFLFVVSGPSGVGKSSIVARVLEQEARLHLSVSVTTRQRRPGEVEGREYCFLTRDEFEHRRSTGALVEWAEVHGQWYGTPREPLTRLLADGYDVLLDIDYQGGLKIRESYPDAALVFVLPPSWDALEARLRGRRSDAESEVQRRLTNAVDEIAHAAGYDYFVVNTDIELAAEQVRAVLAAERQRVARLSGGLSSLLGDPRQAPPGGPVGKVLGGARPPAGRR
jgi:guanylate kinase